MIKTNRVMLLPNKEQEDKFFQFAGSARFAYNWALSKEQENYKNGGKLPKLNMVLDNNIEYDLAMQKFFSSETFDKLMDIETGLYRESSAYVYDMYCYEVSNGYFLQNEI